MNQLEKIPSVPICLPCARHSFGMDIALPAPDPEHPEERCPFCGRLTNQGLYIFLSVR